MRGPHLLSRVYGMVIVIVAVIVFVAFRYHPLVWPLYWFVLLGVVHMYAIVLTRGAALSSAGALLTGATLCSIAAVVLAGDRDFGSADPLVQTLMRILPVLVWVLLTFYMFLVGRRAISKIETASSYFLAASTLTLGFWGVWIFYLENDLVTTPIYQMAVAIGLVLPVLCLCFLFAPGVAKSDRQPWLLTLAALALVVVAANLVLVGPLVSTVRFIVGEFFPRLVGVAPLGQEGMSTGWLGGQEWRTVVTSAMLLVAAALVVVKATQDASRAEAELKPVDMDDQSPARTTAVTTIPGQVINGEVVTETPGAAPSPTSGALARREPVNAAVATENAAGQVAAQAEFEARYLGEIAYLIVTNIFQTLRRAFYAVLPAVAFSLLAMLIVMVLSKLGEYARHGPLINAFSLWGMAVTVLIGAVLLCGIAFDFNPSQERSERQRLRIFGVPLVVVAAGSLLTSLGYFLVSLASWALLPMLWPEDLLASALFTGDLYYVNLAIATVTITLLALLFAVSLAQPKKSRLSGRLFSIPAAVILVGVSATAVALGVTPIRSTIDFVTGPYSPTAEGALRNRLPAELAATCDRDYVLIPGNTASVVCHDADTTTVSFHAFGTATDLDRAYDAATGARGIPAGAGSCGQGWPAEQPYSDSGGSGRVACYSDRRGAWMIWTSGGALGIARRADDRQQELYSNWSTGKYRLRSS